MDQQQPQAPTPTPTHPHPAQAGNPPLSPTTAPSSPQTQPDLVDQKTMWVIATYFLFFVPYLSEKLKNDPFMHFHMRQSLGLLLCWVASAIIGNFEVIWVVSPFIQLFLIVLWFIAVISACKGKQELAPFIGKYFQMIKI